MDEFVCKKCRALLGIFPEETTVKCTCGMVYEIDWSQNPPAATELSEEKAKQFDASMPDSEGSLKVKNLYEEMIRRQRKAIELGIPSLVMKVCLEKIAHLLGYLGLERDLFWLPPGITDVQRSPDDINGVSFKYDQHSYAYTHKIRFDASGPDGDIVFNKYAFAFFVDEKLVFECHGEYEYPNDESDPISPLKTERQLRDEGYCKIGFNDWYKFDPYNIDTFVEGDWIEQIKKLT